MRHQRQGVVRTFPAVLALACVATAGAGRAAAESLLYVLTPQPERGTLKVELSWETAGRETSALGVSPSWGTLKDVPSVLRNTGFMGTTSARQQGPLWILRHGRGATINCVYEVNPGVRQFDWEHTHHPITTPELFCGMGNAFLLVPHEQNGVSERTFEVVLRWRLPAGWRAACSWGAGRTLGDNVRAVDLRNSVYVAGDLATGTFRRDGQTLDIAMSRRFGFDIDEFGEKALEIIKVQCDFMGETAFPPFVISAIPVGEPLPPEDTRIAGTGLYHSFALYIPPQARLNSGVEQLFSHELFHFWNGRILRAADPERLMFWWIEGFTDYYALRLLYEGGVWDAATYAGWLNRHLRDYAQNPAINATNEEILERFWTHRDTYGEVAYQRGQALGLRWHRLARQRGVSDGIDRLLKTLVAQQRTGGAPLSNADVRRAGVRALGDWFGGEFDEYVGAARAVDVPTDALAPEIVGELAQVHEYDPGFDRVATLRDKRVRGLRAGSAAAAAGLREGDRVSAWQLHPDPQRECSLTVQREGRSETIRFFPRGRNLAVVQFAPASPTNTSSEP